MGFFGSHRHDNKDTLDALTDPGSGQVITDEERAAIGAGFGIKGAVDTYAELPDPTTLAAGTLYVVRQSAGAPGGNGLYRVEGEPLTWAFLDSLNLQEAAEVPYDPTASDLEAGNVQEAIDELATRPSMPAGGTTGQMLAKASGADHDTEWVDAPEGGAGGTQIDLSALTEAEVGHFAEYDAYRDYALEVPPITEGLYAKFENDLADETVRHTITPSGGAFATDWAIGTHSRKGGNLDVSGNLDDCHLPGDFALAFVAKGGPGQSVAIDYIDEMWMNPWSLYLFWEDPGMEMPAYVMWGPMQAYYAELPDLGSDPARLEISRSGSTIRLFVNGSVIATETDSAEWGYAVGHDYGDETQNDNPTFGVVLSSGAYLDEFALVKGAPWHTAAYAGYALVQSVKVGDTKLDDEATGPHALWSGEKISGELAEKLDATDVITDPDYYVDGQVLAIGTALDRSLGFAVSELAEDTDHDLIVATKAEYNAEAVIDPSYDYFLEWAYVYLGGSRLLTTYEARQGSVTDDVKDNRNCKKVVGVGGSGGYRGGVWWTGSNGRGYETVAPRSAAFAGSTYGDDFSISMAIHRNNEGAEPYLHYVQDGVEVLRLRWLNATTVRLDFMGSNYDWTGLTQSADAWQWILVERHDGVLRLAVDGVRHATTHSGVTGGVSSYPANTAATGHTYLTDSPECTGVAYTVGVNTSTSYVANLHIGTGLARSLHLNATVDEGIVERRVITTPRRAKYVPAYAADTGIADALAVAVGDTAYYAGQTLLVRVAANNTGAATIDVDGLGAKAIVNGSGAALSGGELVADQIAMLVYNGTAFNLIGG